MALEHIPQSMKYDCLWCAWKLTDKGKVPYDVCTGALARSNDKNTFHSYRVVLNYLGNYAKTDENGKALGGLGLGIFNGYSAIDIDHCIDKNGEISEMAREIIDYCGSYTEYSPSGTGIRIIFKTNFKFDKKKYYTNNHKLGLEIYINGATNKFVTITGNALTIGADVVDVDIKYILDKYMLKQEQVESVGVVGTNTYDINDFLPIDTKLSQLWNSQAGGSGSGESETDLALCSKLAFYLQRDPIAINEAFVSSPYFASKDSTHKNKWLNRADYRENTINMAISGCSNVYTPAQTTRVIYGLNDTGNAHRFVDQFGIDLHYNVDNKLWMMWNGVKWQFDMFNNVRNYAEILIEEMQQECYLLNDLEKQKEALHNVERLFSSKGKDNMIKEAQHLSGMPVSNDAFDRDDYLLNTQNCVVNLRTGQTTEHNKMLLLSKVAGANYVAGDNKPKRFLKFLDEVFDGNKDIIHFMHKWFGYCCTGDCKEQVMVTCVGDGSNGKSLLLQIIGEVLGDYAAISKAELLIEKKYQNNSLTELARLKGIRYCQVNELEMGDVLKEGQVKDITSGNNKVVARFLYGNEFEFLPKFKVNLATNYDPKIRGTDNGVWRRYIKVPFNRIFKGSEVDKDLINKLRDEKDQILGWLVEGCLLWQKEGLELPEILLQEKEQYREANDVIQQWISECCAVRKNYIEKVSDLYDSFKSYCQRYNEYVMSKTMFGKNMSKKFEKYTNGSLFYKGIRIKGDIDERVV